jgi:hypothetical protein
LGEHASDFLHVPTDGFFAGILIGPVGFHLNDAFIGAKVKVMACHSMTEAHGLVTSLVNRGPGLRVSSARGRRGRLSRDRQSIRGESDHA